MGREGGAHVVQERHSNDPNNWAREITKTPFRLTLIFRKINKLRLLVTSSHDLQNFRALYPRARSDEHYNFNVTHFSKIGAKNKSRIYAN